MKLRNQLLALFCLGMFGVLGVVYIRAWVVPKTFGVILFLSDSLVASHLTAARLYEGGAEYRLALEGFPHLAMLRNSADDFAVPDAASAGTAFATGRKVNHRRLSVDESGKPLKTLIEIARTQGRSTGLVTNGSLTDSTLAAFYAHGTEARDYGTVAKQFLQANIDVALGGGAAMFSTNQSTGNGENLLGKRFEFVRTKAELENAGGYRSSALLGLFADADLAHADQIDAASQQPSLADMVRRAIQFLETDRNGYLLVVDATLATRAAERNEGERVIQETVALDRAIATAAKYAGEKSLIIAAGKHGLGGMSLNGFPLKHDHGIALLGVNPVGYPAITWATGPAGEGEAAPPRAKTEPAAFYTPAAVHTAEDVIAVGRGEGSEMLRGFLDNTAVFEILRGAL